jgi:hypothetical protein
MKNMLNVCDEYSKIWKIKFNPNKSTLLLSGKPIYNCNQINCYLNNQQLGIVNEFKYLGLMINQKNKFEKFRIDKMLKAQRCFFGLNKYGTTPAGLSPATKSFIYNNYCLPIGLYGIGISFLHKNVLRKLNQIQNNTLRGTLGLHKHCHVSKIKHILKIQEIETIYYKFKLSLVNLILRHPTTKSILHHLINYNTCNHKYSIVTDLNNMANLLNCNITTIVENYKKAYNDILEKVNTIDIDDDEYIKIKDILSEYGTGYIRPLISIVGSFDVT